MPPPNSGSMRRQEPPALDSVMDWAGAFLARRPHSEAELRAKLLRRGAAHETVDAAIERMRALALVDDSAFAEAWAAERRRRGRGPAWVIAELEAKGIERETAEAAAGTDEDEAAAAAATGLLRRVAHRPLAEQARRLLEMLGRRGFSEEAALRAVRAVLPPEGWD
ncbi:MAG TPA: regulatory protein RecX [Actinomycetota bacterium]|jgi:regulatory protein|nr:regulatory protein RecX [Actinomycetota bacterium]